jgi:hypothetical protein
MHKQGQRKGPQRRSLLRRGKFKAFVVAVHGPYGLFAYLPVFTASATRVTPASCNAPITLTTVS